MAFIGLRYPVYAPITAETSGSAITYGAGKVAGHAIQANLTMTRASNPLYGDDVEIENDNSLTGMEISLGVDDLLDDVRSELLGEVQAGTEQQPVYREVADSAPYVGFGYIRVRRKNGETKFQACWLHKVIFGMESEDTQTKGENIEWQTPTLTGRVMGVYLDETGKAAFRDRATFDTEAAAKAWINGKAGISA